MQIFHENNLMLDTWQQHLFSSKWKLKFKAVAHVNTRQLSKFGGFMAAALLGVVWQVACGGKC